MYIEGASLNAVDHDVLMLWVNIVTILSFVILNSVLIFLVIRYRRRGPNDITSKTDNSTILEIIWTVVPTLVLIWFYIWGMIVFIELRTIPENAMEINATAKQWAWDFVYPPEVRKNKDTLLKTSGKLYLEAGRPVKVVMKSTDVIHSFFVPAFRIKEDILPNLYTYVSFTPVLLDHYKEKGRAEYDIYCAEFCGRNHSAMLGKAIVLSPEKFRLAMKEIEEIAGDISAKRGKGIYDGNCKTCHTLDGSPLVGPSFKGLWQNERLLADGTKVVADENYIRNSILEPNQQVLSGYPAAMPVQDYNDAEIQSIIEYLKSVK